MRAVHLMLDADYPDDYVVATGEAYNVADFAEYAFQEVELDWKKYVEVDERLVRPNEVKYLLGDPSKIRNQLGWKPEISLRTLIKERVESDLQKLNRVYP